MRCEYASFTLLIPIVQPLCPYQSAHPYRLPLIVTAEPATISSNQVHLNNRTKYPVFNNYVWVIF